MIGVDTNVLVRYVIEGDTGAGDTGARDLAQRHAARRFFAARTPDDPAAISVVTLVEFVWVLSRSYGYSDAEVARVIRGLCRSRDAVVHHETSVIRALRDAESSGAGIADAIIAHLGVAAGAEGTVTFDRRASTLPGMLLMETAEAAST